MLDQLATLFELAAGVASGALGASPEASKTIKAFAGAAAKGIASFAVHKESSAAIYAAIEALNDKKAGEKFEGFKP